MVTFGAKKKRRCLVQQPVREAISYRELFTAGWFGVREKHYSWLEIYDRLRASEQDKSVSDHRGNMLIRQCPVGSLIRYVLH